VGLRGSIGPGGAGELRRFDVDEFTCFGDGASEGPLGVAEPVLGGEKLAANFAL